MTQFVSLFILAFAVSLDSFGVGVTYGLRKVYIPLRSILIIAFCSGVSIVIAMFVGEGISLFISSKFAEMLGGIILIGIGALAIINIYRTSDETVDTAKPQEREESQTQNKSVWTIELRKFGIVIQILRKPMMADIDRSGIISGMEAFILGTALSLDAFGAGIGAALLGYSPCQAAILMAFMSSLFIFLGIKCGSYMAKGSLMSKISYMPGIILILFGIMRIF